MPKELFGLVDETAQRFLSDPDKLIVRPAGELALDLDAGRAPQCYTDPRLRFVPGLMRELINALHAGGLMVFRPRVQAFVGLFTVLKKDQFHQRLIIDARVANWSHKKPPYSGPAVHTRRRERDPISSSPRP